MAIGYPGGINTYVPTLELSGNLMVNFSRNINQFPLNKYVTVTPVKLPRGAYLKFNPLDLGRVRSAPHGNKWASGTLSPTGFHDNIGFIQNTFEAQRYAFAMTLDKLAVDVANWPIQKTHSEALAQEAMTGRAYQVCSKITTSGNYDSTHVKTANAIAGGFLDGGTTADPRIMKALQAASLIIQGDTMGRVKQGELSVLMNATTASKLSRSRELREYLMQSPGAREQITLSDKNYNSRYGLPNDLYTFKVIVEDTYYNAGIRGQTSETSSPVFPDNTILVLVRKGDLESVEGAASYSTVHLFMYEDMTVEAKDEAWQRLLELRVVDHFDTQIVAPVTAVLITNVFS